MREQPDFDFCCLSAEDYRSVSVFQAHSNNTRVTVGATQVIVCLFSQPAHTGPLGQGHMKDLAIATDRLRRAVAEVEDRIRPEETHLARLEPDQIDADAWTTESGLHAIAAWFKSGNLVPFAPQAAAPANAAVSQQRTAPAPTVAALSILISLIRRGRGALLALSFRVKAAAALQTLTAKPKSPVVGDSTSGRSNDDHPFKARLDAFGESLLATTRRAVEVNGIVSRPAETLVGALAELEPRREGRRRNYQKSLVPDG